jgi:hypothetical protein
VEDKREKGKGVHLPKSIKKIKSIKNAHLPKSIRNIKRKERVQENVHDFAKKGKNSGIICSFCREKIFFTLEIKYLFIIMTTPAKELGITGDFRIDGEDWVKFTNLSVAVSKNRQFRNMLFISFNYESKHVRRSTLDIKAREHKGADGNQLYQNYELMYDKQKTDIIIRNKEKADKRRKGQVDDVGADEEVPKYISDTERTYKFVDEIRTENIYSNVIENKNITYNDVIAKNRGYLRGLTPKSNRIDIIGMNILSATHKYSFSIDTLENYNKVLDDIADIKKQIKQEIHAKKEDEQNLVQVAIEEGILKPGATYDDLVNYNSLQKYIKEGKLKPGATPEDLNDMEKILENNKVKEAYRRRWGGRKTRRRKAHPSTKKHKKRASTKKHKKYKKKRPRTRKR